MNQKNSATKVAPQEIKNDCLNIQLCSGFGQYHSDKAEKNAKDFISVTLADIEQMLVNPPEVPKPQAQWCIFSTLPSREHAEQRRSGQFYALWADIDDPQGMTLEQMFSQAVFVLPFNLIAYTSKSATEDNQKARIIIPLGAPVNGSTFAIMQKVLNDKLETAGIKPDIVTPRTGQICYLPNRGEFYDFQENAFSDALTADHWSAEIDAEIQRLNAEAEALKQRRNAAQLKAMQRMASGEKSPINAFNAAYDIELMLTTFGYLQKGKRYVSPLSESGSPAVVITPDGNRWISHHASDLAAGIGKRSDSGDTCSGDAFDLFKFYQHGNDQAAALKAAGAMFTTAEGVSITKANQREYMAAQAQVSADAEFEHYDNMTNPLEAPAKAKFDFKTFSMNGQSSTMRLQMLEDKYVLGKLAILGQATAFYAKPNSGKTLLTIWLLIEAIKAGDINGEDVFYINADDNFKGLVTKLEMAEKHGFNMVAPGFNGFETPKFMDYLAELIRIDDARGKVIILDTLKKFTNIMDKKVASDFGRYMRSFVSKGGTIIMLAHTNKNRDDSGKVVFSGTSDIVDDVDCAYTLDVSESSGDMKTVLFENIKSRGDVEKEAAYTYQAKATDYQGLIDSVMPVSDEFAEAAKAMRIIDIKLNKNQEAIEAILEAIEAGHTLKTDLIKEARKESGISESKIRDALKDHTGENYHQGHRWREFKGDSKNAKVYRALSIFGNLQSYQEARDGN